MKYKPVELQQTETVAVKLTPSQRQLLEAASELEGLPLSAIARRAIMYYLQDWAREHQREPQEQAA